MRRYVADVLETALLTLCCITGHARGCWLIMEAPLVSRLYFWAMNTRYDDPSYPGHAACPKCHFDRTEYVHRDEYDAAMERDYTDAVNEGKAIRDVELRRSWTSTTSGASGTTITAWPPS